MIVLTSKNAKGSLDKTERKQENIFLMMEAYRITTTEKEMEQTLLPLDGSREQNICTIVLSQARCDLSMAESKNDLDYQDGCGAGGMSSFGFNSSLFPFLLTFPLFFPSLLSILFSNFDLLFLNSP